MTKPIAPMPPREKLTEKAHAAITAYVLARLDGIYYMHNCIKFSVQAERMPRAKLYGWLTGRGYRWNAKKGQWLK